MKKLENAFLKIAADKRSAVIPYSAGHREEDAPKKRGKLRSQRKKQKIKKSSAGQRPKGVDPDREAYRENLRELTRTF